jgi:hypothetical protein
MDTLREITLDDADAEELKRLRQIDFDIFDEADPMPQASPAKRRKLSFCDEEQDQQQLSASGSRSCHMDAQMDALMLVSPSVPIIPV